MTPKFLHRISDVHITFNFSTIAFSQILKWCFKFSRNVSKISDSKALEKKDEKYYLDNSIHKNVLFCLTFSNIPTAF